MQFDAMAVEHEDKRRYAFLARPTGLNGVQSIHIGSSTFTDPAEARQLGVRIISASLAHVWQPFPTLLWVGSVALIALMAALSFGCSARGGVVLLWRVSRSWSP